MKRHQRQKWLILLIAALSSFIIAIVWQQIFTPVEAETKPELSTPTKESALLNLAKVSDGIYALIANTDYPPPEPNIAICNAGIVIGTEGVLVIDPFQNEALG
ncbi:MAG: MBL fold metallo-hydrolase, partial [Cyanobacteria bacterium J083]